MKKSRVWHLKLPRSHEKYISHYIYEIDLDLPDGTTAVVDYAFEAPVDMENEQPILDALECCENILIAMRVSGRGWFRIKDVCQFPTIT